MRRGGRAGMVSERSPAQQDEARKSEVERRAAVALLGRLTVSISKEALEQNEETRFHSILKKTS